MAATFEAPSREFLRAAVREPPRFAVDLGCGPGFTTALVAAETGAACTIGVDLSLDFLGHAAAVPGSAGAVAADVRAPLPCRPPDLVYARLLLAHLADVAGTVARWAGQLAPGGRLVLDEIDAITTDVEALARYEEIVVGLVGSRGASMYAGPAMAEVREGPGWRQVLDRRVDFAVDPRAAAEMFAMNLGVWRDDPFIRAHHAAAELDDLAGGLAGVRSGTITWTLRQVAIVSAEGRSSG